MIFVYAPTICDTVFYLVRNLVFLSVIHTYKENNKFFNILIWYVPALFTYFPYNIPGDNVAV